MERLLPKTINDLRQKIHSGEISMESALLAQHANFRSDEWNSVVDHFDIEKSFSDPNLPLAGIGLAHKDIFVLPGHMPSCGANENPLFDNTPSPVVGRLIDAGASNLGTLSMAEFACGITGENLNKPRCVNPINNKYAVGGSSSGSGVALSASICYGSLGTDTAGSVRAPAATCGVLGLKPSNGLLESDGCFPLAPNLDTIGIMARSADDCSLLFDLVLSPAAREKVNISVKNNNLRVALVTNHSSTRYSAKPGIRDCFIKLANSLADQVVLLDGLDDLPVMIKNASIILHAEAAFTHFKRLQKIEKPELMHVARATSLPGVAIPAVWYLKAVKESTNLRNIFIEKYLKDSDILITPVLPHGVPLWSQVDTSSQDFDAQALLAMLSWTSFVNYIGLPAMAIPVGIDDEGMPISVQVIARPFEEFRLLKFAQYAESHFFNPMKNF